MNAREFVDKLNGNTFQFCRIFIPSGEVTERSDVTPRDPCYVEGGANIKIRSIHCYGDHDLFYEDDNMLVAVLQSGTGKIWCDRFEAIK